MKIVKHKHILIFVVLVLVGVQGTAQQIPHYSQFWFNDFGTNPAFAGTKPYYQAKSNNRYQWVGVTDAPKTFVLNAFGPERNKDMGYGVQLFSDVTGHTSRMGFYASYAYNLKLNDELRISMGLNMGMIQYKIDGVKLHDANDIINDGVYADFVPDADFGFLIYTDKWHGGLVAKQLFNYNLDIEDVTDLGFNRLKTHFLAHGAYRYDFDEEWAVEPFALVKFLYPAPLQIDMGARGIWRKMLWLGLTWRSADAVSFMLGYEYEEQISFGYSYDITTSGLGAASSGTHEIMIGFKFSKIKKNRGKSKL